MNLSANVTLGNAIVTNDSGNVTLDTARAGDRSPRGMDDSPAGEFLQMLSLLVFVLLLWVVGKIVSRIGMPALVGEIMVGCLLGPVGPMAGVLPPGVGIPAPTAHTLVLIGEVGLCLLVLEGGMHVDIEMLKIVGLRGLAVGLLGSALPQALGFVISTYALELGPLEAFAASAALAAMSTGIALNVLKAGGVLNQPLGQLCLAAAVVNEMYNIILLTELGAAIKKPDGAEEYYVPIVVMFGLVAGMGFAAVRVVPRLLDRAVLPRVPRGQRQNVVLAFVFGMALVLMPICVTTGSSELLGAFLAGFCFCTDKHVHHTWNRQVKRVMHWTMRIFFACSIGFSIPIASFGSAAVWGRAGLFSLCIIGKLVVGVLATSRHRYEMLALAFAWGGWGEFSFIIGKTALKAGVIDELTFNGLVLAVLMSIVVCPLLLRITLGRMARSARRDIARAKGETARVSDASTVIIAVAHDAEDAGVGPMWHGARGQQQLAPAAAAAVLGKKGQLEQSAYYCLQTKSHARWGQQQALLSCIASNDLKIVDFRAFHPHNGIGERHVVNEVYLRDKKLKLPVGAAGGSMIHTMALQKSQAEVDDAAHLQAEYSAPRAALAARINGVEHAVRRALHDRTAVIRIRQWLPGSPALVAEGDVTGSMLEAHASRTAHARLNARSRARNARRQQHAEFGHADALDATRAGCFAMRPHHELDGYVHRDEHDAFSDRDDDDDDDIDDDDVSGGGNGEDDNYDRDRDQASDMGGRGDASKAAAGGRAGKMGGWPRLDTGSSHSHCSCSSDDDDSEETSSIVLSGAAWEMPLRPAADEVNRTGGDLGHGPRRCPGRHAIGGSGRGGQRRRVTSLEQGSLVDLAITTLFGHRTVANIGLHGDAPAGSGGEGRGGPLASPQGTTGPATKC